MCDGCPWRLALDVLQVVHSRTTSEEGLPDDRMPPLVRSARCSHERWQALYFWCAANSNMLLRQAARGRQGPREIRSARHRAVESRSLTPAWSTIVSPVSLPRREASNIQGNMKA